MTGPRTDAGAPAFEDTADRERRLHLVQLTVLVIAVVAAAVAVAVLGRQVLSAQDRRDDEAATSQALVALRSEFKSRQAEFWRVRGTARAVPLAGFRVYLPLGTALLRGIASDDPVLQAEEAAATRRALDALDGLARIMDAEPLDVGSAAELDALRRSERYRQQLDDALGDWLAAQDEEVEEARAEADRTSGRLGVTLSLILGGLAAAVAATWLLIDRVRRRLLAGVHRQAEERGAILTAMQDGLIAVGPDGRVVEVNAGFTRLTGFTRDDLIGTGMPRPYWPPEESDVLASADARHVAGEAGVLEHDVRRADGSVFPATVAFVPLASHGGYLATVTDATDDRRAARELRRSAQEQAALGRVATAVAALEGVRLDDVFALVAEEVARLFGVEGGRVGRFEDGHVRIVGWWNDADGPARLRPALERLPLDGESSMGRVHLTGRPARIDDFAAAGEGTAAVLGRSLSSSIAAPVRVGSTLWGAVAAVTAGGAFPPGAEEELARFAELVGLSVANAEARARLAAQATVDPLTSLANHREFHERLAVEFARARRHRRDLALALFDIDNFKQINDAYGHNVGDAVIAEVGRRLAAAAGPGDLPARIGGEEFAVILPEATGMRGWAEADRLREVVASQPFPGVGSITLSAGVCDLNQSQSPEELFRLADGALYWAKAHGRDVAFLYSPDVVRELSAAERAERLERVQALAGLRGLARAVDAKDPSTRLHSERVAELAVAIAGELGWDEARRQLLREAGMLHDVGKIGVPDAVLFKPGRLTDEEYELVKQHAPLGARMVTDILGDEQVAWVRHHHERFDGRGYPDGVAGAAIPDGARILAVADSWDVMTSDRPYTSALDVTAALSELARCRGTQFDPDVADAMERLVSRGGLGELTLPRAAVAADAPAW